jgi:hypothetical protein
MFILALFAPYFVAFFVRSCRLRTQTAPHPAQKPLKILKKNKFKTSAKYNLSESKLIGAYNKLFILWPETDILAENC